MKFAMLYELQLPKPFDQDRWGPDDERRIVHETLEQIELADRLGYEAVYSLLWLPPPMLPVETGRQPLP